MSPRAQGPFVAVNCGAIPKELIESTLFGHEKGAFTGAVDRQKGKFEQADGGTLFLDEVGDMPLEAQTKVLRVLEDQFLTRVGGGGVQIKVDVRVVAATNKDLRKAVADGLFREDLYYRLAVVPIDVPPMRERRSDIAMLAKSFLAEAAKAHGHEPAPAFTPKALEYLAGESWPGNVRQLKNLVERALILLEGETFDARRGGVAHGPLGRRGPADARTASTCSRRARRSTSSRTSRRSCSCSSSSRRTSGT